MVSSRGPFFGAASGSLFLRRIKFMRSEWILCGLLGLASVMYAKEPRAYQTGKVVQMDSVKCGTSEKDATSLAGEMLGNDSGSRKTQDLMCQEYVLQTERVTYRIRPRDEKHPALLPVGEVAQFRLLKD